MNVLIGGPDLFLSIQCDTLGTANNQLSSCLHLEILVHCAGDPTGCYGTAPQIDRRLFQVVRGLSGAEYELPRHWTADIKVVYIPEVRLIQSHVESVVDMSIAKHQVKQNVAVLSTDGHRSVQEALDNSIAFLNPVQVNVVELH